MNNSLTKINISPTLTWNWLKMNNDTLNLKNDLSSFCEQEPTFKDVPKGFSINKVSKTLIDFTIPSSSIFNFMPQKDKVQKYEYLDTPHPTEVQINQVCKNAQVITIDGNLTTPLIINIDENQNNNQISKQIIYATENSDATIIYVYNSDNTNKEKTQIIQTKIFVSENAKLNIIKVQLLGKNTLQLDDTSFICKENSNVSFTQIELGGLHINSGLNVKLDGYNACFNANVSYFAKEGQYFDFNHVVDHYAKKTISNMNVAGSLKDDAIKVYRGTIDFKKGCAGSKGNELEETLLLSPKVVNKSLPMILCSEEDVEGEHGATIGKLSNEVLFYLQTRGISCKEAEKLMTLAKIKLCQDQIPDEEVNKKIDNFLD